MSFRLVPNSVTLNDLERRNSYKPLRNFTEFASYRDGLRKSGEDTPILSAAVM